jgi:hypothetical protein
MTSHEIKITVSLSDEDRALLVAAASGRAATAAGTGVVPTPGTETPPAGKKPRTPRKPAATTPPPAETPADDGFEGEEGEDGFDADEKVTQEQVHTALRALATASNKAAAMKVLKEVGGVAGFSELPEDKFAAVKKALEAAMPAE